MDFQRLLLTYRVPFDDTALKRGWVNVQCPHCSDKSMNGGFNVFADYYYCWRCGKHPLERTLSRVLAIPLPAVRELMGEYDNRVMIASALNRKGTKGGVRSLKLPGGAFTPTEEKYLLGRRFSPRHLAEKYGVAGGGVTGLWRYRIIIPLFERGRLVSWTARSILSARKLKETGQPRYKQLSVSESVVDPKRVLYNIDNCGGQRLCLLEGPLDVIRMGDGFACSFGTEMTQAQIRYVRDRYSWVGIMFDSEPEAQRKAKRYALQLSALGVSVEVIDAFGDFGKTDAGELSPRQALRLRGELGF